MSKKLTADFFRRDVLEVAPDLVGKLIVRRLPDGSLLTERIAETEAYRAPEDLACHAAKGRTPRTELLFGESGRLYVYLCYGLHWLLNVVTGQEGQPQGVLIRAGEVHDGPAKLTKYLRITGELNGQPVCGNDQIWLEDDGCRPVIRTAPRVGIDYAGDFWKAVEWRFIAEKEE